MFQPPRVHIPFSSFFSDGNESGETQDADYAPKLEAIVEVIEEADDHLSQAQLIPNGSVMDQESEDSGDSEDEEGEFRYVVSDFAKKHGTHTAKALFAIEIKKIEKKESPLKKQRKH